MTEKQMKKVVKVVKADAEQATIEYKNRLAANLKIYAEDFEELRTMPTDEIGEALKDTITSMLNVLTKAGIEILKEKY